MINPEPVFFHNATKLVDENDEAVVLNLALITNVPGAIVLTKKGVPGKFPENLNSVVVADKAPACKAAGKSELIFFQPCNWYSVCKIPMPVT